MISHSHSFSFRDHLRDHLYPQAETTSETTAPDTPEIPTNTGRDHLRDHPRPLDPGEGVRGGPCKGTTPTPHLAHPRAGANQ